VVTPGGSTLYVATRGSDGAVYALSTSDGSILGTIGSGGTSGTLALSPRYGYLYAGTPAGLVSALPSGGGSPVWSAGTFVPESVNAAAIGADGTVYASGGSSLVAVSGESGASKWSFTAPGSGTLLSSPAIGPDGTVYVASQGTGSGANQLYAFELT
jgi:eukaryotic-like serine/threonine-protein kinase